VPGNNNKKGVSHTGFLNGLMEFESQYGDPLLRFADSPLRNALSGGVLKLAELGKLHQMKTRWWKQKRGGGACSVIRPKNR